MGWLKAGTEGINAGFVTQVTADIASIAAATVATTSLTVPGVAAGDFVAVSPAAALSVAVGVCHAVATAADTVVMSVVNPTAGALDPASAAFEVMVLKPGNCRLT